MFKWTRLLVVLMNLSNSSIQLFIPKLRPTFKWHNFLHCKAPSITYLRPVLVSSVILADTSTWRIEFMVISPPKRALKPVPPRLF